MKGARRAGAAGLLAVGAVAGVLAWGGFHTAMDATNTLEFCVSCHEMASTVYEEYKTTAHYKNASGVRAVCADCHVPREFVDKVVRKVQASAEVYHHFAGTIGTPEKFEEKRAELAERVWARMKATDSRECMHCHTWESMDHAKQTERAREKKAQARRDGQTCIDCHKGIAHRSPKRDD